METRNTNYSIVSIKSIFEKYFFYWRYFALGLVFSFLIAFAYLQIVPTTYEIKANILINDKKKAPESRSVLEELDVSTSPNIVENELGVLKSWGLMNKVVNDLQLWIVYLEKNKLSTKDLYLESPVNFQVIELKKELNETSFSVNIIDAKSFILKTKDKENRVNFGDTIEADFGSWQLFPKNNLEEFLGSNLKVVLNNPEDVTKNYLKSLDVFLESKLGAFVNLTIEDQNIQRGKDILNSLIEYYNQSSLLEKNRITQSTLEFIDTRLASLSQELVLAELEVEGYRSSQGLTDISSQSQVFLQNVQSNDAKLNEVNVQLSILEGIEKVLKSPDNKFVIPSTIGLSDQALNSLIEKLSLLLLQKEKMLATTPENNPVFEPINRQINSTKLAIEENLEVTKLSLLNAKSELQLFNSKFESAIRNIPQQERLFLGFKREQAIKEDLYVYLLKKREEISLSYASTLNDIRVIDQAFKGQKKSPKKAFVFALALVVGLIPPGLMVYFKDNFNDYILSKEEIEEYTGLEVISELNNTNSTTAKNLKDTGFSVFGEQLRTLRTKLYFLKADAVKHKVTLFTSSVGGEGKSFVSSCISTTFSDAGKKTVILDLDLRKPKIAGIFEISTKSPGISDFLNNECQLNDIIQNSKISPLLDVISSGRPVNNPSEILENSKLDELIENLKLNYDEIIIDSPPLHLVTDAFIISRLVDTTVYLIRQGKTRKSELKFINGIKKQEVLPNLILVLNGVNKKKYGYGYDYDLSYYDSRRKT
jgi:tyrosine-protein kinase Etk/Wzc